MNANDESNKNPNEISSGNAEDYNVLSQMPAAHCFLCSIFIYHVWMVKTSRAIIYCFSEGT